MAEGFLLESCWHVPPTPVDQGLALGWLSDCNGISIIKAEKASNLKSTLLDTL